MLDVGKESRRIFELFLQTSEHVPETTKDKFKHLKILDEIKQRANLCLNATGDSRFWELSEMIGKMENEIKDTFTQNEEMKYLFTNWWEKEGEIKMTKIGRLHWNMENKRWKVIDENGEELNYGFHCGHCMEVYCNGEWIPTRIEAGFETGEFSDYYLVGTPFKYNLENLQVRNF